MKKQAFEYVIYKLIEWFKTENNIQSNETFNLSNDLTKLKIIKLHFFTSAIDSNKNSLLNLFDNFYAMPFGHVESDLYNSIEQLDRYTITKSSLLIKREYLNNLTNTFNDVSEIYKQEIDTAIEDLKQENSKIIDLQALDLVDISHNYFSWKCMFNIARANNRYSEFIPSKLIKEETKFFALN